MHRAICTCKGQAICMLPSRTLMKWLIVFRHALPAVLAIACAGLGFAASDVKVESSRAVSSPDGSRSVVVDHLIPIVDGEAERYSGRMLVRVADEGGTATKQRFMETSQIRLISPGRWMDDQWFTFTYDISKNSRGVVAFNANSGRAVQVESVRTTRKMGATGKVETELTDLEIADYGDTITRVRNVTRNLKSVFPLYLTDLTYLVGKPIAREHVTEIENALRALAEFKEKNSAEDLLLEEASESFNPSDTHMAVLACKAAKPQLLIVPTNAPSADDALAGAKLSELGDDVKLTCLFEPVEGFESEDETAPDETTPQAPDTVGQDESNPAPSEQFGGMRFATSWKNEGTVLIEMESFETEDEAAKREALFSATLDGTVTRLKTVPKPAATPKPEAAARLDAPATTASATPRAQVEDVAPQPTATPARATPTPRAATTTPRQPATTRRTPRQQRMAATPVAATPSPTARRGIFRRMLPGGRQEQPPTPARVTPSE